MLASVRNDLWAIATKARNRSSPSPDNSSRSAISIPAQKDGPSPPHQHGSDVVIRACQVGRLSEFFEHLDLCCIPLLRPARAISAMPSRAAYVMVSNVPIGLLRQRMRWNLYHR
jgi:hypothetical protein